MAKIKINNYRVKEAIVFISIPFIILAYTYLLYFNETNSEISKYKEDALKTIEKIEISLNKTKELLSFIKDRVEKSRDPSKEKSRFNAGIYSSNKTLGTPPIQDLKFLNLNQLKHLEGNALDENHNIIVHNQNIYMYNRIENMNEYVLLKMKIPDILSFIDKEYLTGKIILKSIDGHVKDKKEIKGLFTKNLSSGLYAFVDIPKPTTYTVYIRNHSVIFINFLGYTFLIVFALYIFFRIRTKELRNQFEVAISEASSNKAAQFEIQNEMVEKTEATENSKKATVLRNAFYREINKRRSQMLDEIIAGSHIMAEGIISESIDKGKVSMLIDNILETATKLQESVYKKTSKCDFYDICKIVSECVSMYYDLINNKDLIVDISGSEIKCFGDQFISRLIIANIIEKVVINSKRSTKIYINLSSSEKGTIVSIFFEEILISPDYVSFKSSEKSSLKMIRLEDEQLMKNAAAVGISYEKIKNKDQSSNYVLRIPNKMEKGTVERDYSLEENVVKVSFR